VSCPIQEVVRWLISTAGLSLFLPFLTVPTTCVSGHVILQMGSPRLEDHATNRASAPERG